MHYHKLIEAFDFNKLSKKGVNDIINNNINQFNNSFKEATIYSFLEKTNEETLKIEYFENRKLVPHNVVIGILKQGISIIDNVLQIGFQPAEYNFIFQQLETFYEFIDLCTNCGITKIKNNISLSIDDFREFTLNTDIQFERLTLNNIGFRYKNYIKAKGIILYKCIFIDYDNIIIDADTVLLSHCLDYQKFSFLKNTKTLIINISFVTYQIKRYLPYTLNFISLPETITNFKIGLGRDILADSNYILTCEGLSENIENIKIILSEGNLNNFSFKGLPENVLDKNNTEITILDIRKGFYINECDVKNIKKMLYNNVYIISYDGDYKLKNIIKKTKVE